MTSRMKLHHLLVVVGILVVGFAPACASDPDVGDGTEEVGGGGGGGGGGTTKVTICHIPPGNPANAHTITVGAPAVDAHLAHGDTLGACVDAGLPDVSDAAVAPPDATIPAPIIDGDIP